MRRLFTLRHLPAYRPKELKNARSVLQKAAEAGDADAQRDLANMYAFGHGVGQNIELSVSLNEKVRSTW